MKSPLIAALALTTALTALNVADAAARRGGSSRGRVSGGFQRRSTGFRSTGGYRRNTMIRRTPTTNRRIGTTNRRIPTTRRTTTGRHLNKHVTGHKHLGGHKYIGGKQYFGGKKQILPVRPKNGHVIRNHKWHGKINKHYHLKHGHKFTHGFYFKGKLHHHWTKKVFFAKLGCYCHWCPNTRGYYYWCAPHGRYYPVSYCPTGVYAY